MSVGLSVRHEHVGWLIYVMVIVITYTDTERRLSYGFTQATTSASWRAFVVDVSSSPAIWLVNTLRYGTTSFTLLIRATYTLIIVSPYGYVATFVYRHRLHCR